MSKFCIYKLTPFESLLFVWNFESGLIVLEDYLRSVTLYFILLDCI